MVQITYGQTKFFYHRRTGLKKIKKKGVSFGSMDGKNYAEIPLNDL
jgi:hypothetical protein